MYVYPCLLPISLSLYIYLSIYIYIYKGRHTIIYKSGTPPGSASGNPLEIPSGILAISNLQGGRGRPRRLLRLRGLHYNII